MLKGGVIMDVTTAAEARIAEEAGAHTLKIYSLFGSKKLVLDDYFGGAHPKSKERERPNHALPFFDTQQLSPIYLKGAV